MKAEQSVFISLLADYIAGRASDFLCPYAEDPQSSLDWDLLARYAREQSLEGIVYVQLKKSIPPERIPAQLRHGFDSEIYLAVNREAELRAVLKRIPSAPVILMKGMIFQENYPCPLLRTMGDIDLVIRTEDRSYTDCAMLAEGYSKDTKNPDVWTYTKEHIIFELHDHMFYEFLANDVDYRGYFDSVWQHVRNTDFGENVFRPSEEYHFLYLMVHLAKHITNRGYGFRGFLDIVFFCKAKGTQTDWQWIAQELEKLKLLDFTVAVFSLCERWFGVQMPIRTRQLSQSFFEETSQKMFRDGIFGLQNTENDMGVMTKKRRKSGSSYLLFSVRYLLHLLFPAYRYMRGIPWYQFVDGKPWLMPVAWIYRWFYILVHKFRHAIRLLAQPFTERKHMHEREEYLDDWGL